MRLVSAPEFAAAIGASSESESLNQRKNGFSGLSGPSVFDNGGRIVLIDCSERGAGLTSRWVRGRVVITAVCPKGSGCEAGVAAGSSIRSVNGQRPGSHWEVTDACEKAAERGGGVALCIED